MKENPCETAAVRISIWIGKDKDNLLGFKPQFQREFLKKHKCDLVKPPRIPSQVKHLPMQGYALKKKKGTKQRLITKNHQSLKVVIDPSSCCVNQKFYAPMLPKLFSWRLKEHAVVRKRLKIISKQKLAGPKRHDVVPIASSKKQDPITNPYIEEMNKVNEERHFQIGRVIKYLS
jgi:hypothetical protein